MTRLVDLEHKLYSADPTIRVYTTRFILNAAALRLLGISEQSSRVFIRIDQQQAVLGRQRLYIARSDKPIGYAVRRRNNRGLVSSVSLCQQLAERLNGYGAYRICEEASIQEDGLTWYEIFFRKYD